MEERIVRENALKEFVDVIQGDSYSAYEKEIAISEILNQFEPFRKSLGKKFANKGVPFDDICQQIDLKMIEAMYDYDESKDPSAIRHITSKTRNGVWNYYKKEMNYFDETRKTLSLDYTYTLSLDGYNVPIEGESYLESYLDISYTMNEDYIVDCIVIKDEIDSLTNHQKDILNMYYVDDMKQEEIADYLNINQANVSRATKRGIKRLRENLSLLDEHDDTL